MRYTWPIYRIGFISAKTLVNLESTFCKHLHPQNGDKYLHGEILPSVRVFHRCFSWETSANVSWWQFGGLRIYVPCLWLSQLELLPDSHFLEKEGIHANCLKGAHGVGEGCSVSRWLAEAIRNGLTWRSAVAAGRLKELGFLILGTGSMSQPATQTRSLAVIPDSSSVTSNWS